jgi:hypothetical protein
VLVLIMTLHSFGEGYVLGLASGRPVCIADSGSAPLCLCCACAVLVLCLCCAAAPVLASASQVSQASSRGCLSLWPSACTTFPRAWPLHVRLAFLLCPALLGAGSFR